MIMLYLECEMRIHLHRYCHIFFVNFCQSKMRKNAKKVQRAHSQGLRKSFEIHQTLSNLLLKIEAGR